MMNRPGTGPQQLRGMPGAFGGQQQPQSGRAVSNRLPNGGKMAPVNNGSWPFGGGMPMGGGASVSQASTRQLGGSVSFAQSVSGSQPSTPLDPSDFPSLSNTTQLGGSSQSNMWSSAGSRNMVPASQRGSAMPLPSQQGQQDDFFGTARLPSNQGTFRFGNQSQAAQGQAAGGDDFPPLNNRPAGGEIGAHDRGANLMSGLGFGSQGATPTAHSSRAGNGLLNAISANTRAAEARSPTAIGRPQDSRSPTEDDARQKHGGYREDSLASSIADNAGNRNPLGAIGNDAPSGKQKEDEKAKASEVQDPLEGLSDTDKWGLKGLRHLMNTHPDYNAVMCGMDLNTLGLDLTSKEPISDQIYSLFDDTPPQPAPKFRLPDCYEVKNVQPIEAKIGSFNEETLMWIFYSCPNDVQQQMAFAELAARGWKWNKRLHLWMTKDNIVAPPQPLSNELERGFYIVWDTNTWRKERRELTIAYSDLAPSTSPLPMP
ncbi:hypothetical protein QBC47DRAFT_371988 [Echria macrotheca]|uniref:NOT2/NOT3/NOT5 C-terminal domain-containing protein n=1 Tax=Echria macrotheca TaxID=438768 RepID=A0AAJ0FDL4_9PEZI|nr:hypothetical protein QBC47DRAFT_371988 [Echria macrotheca]